jgi:hypothetical protein
MGWLNQGRMGALLRRALALKRRKDRLTAYGYAVARAQLHAELNWLLSETSTNPDNARLAKPLRKHRASVLVFLDHDAVDATNQPGRAKVRPVR